MTWFYLDCQNVSKYTLFTSYIHDFSLNLGEGKFSTKTHLFAPCRTRTFSIFLQSILERNVRNIIAFKFTGRKTTFCRNIENIYRVVVSCRTCWWLPRVTLVVGFGFLPQIGKILGRWCAPTNAISHSLNVDRMVFLLWDGGDTSTLYAVVKVVWMFCT